MTNRSKVPFHHTAFKTAVCATTLTALLAIATSAQAQIFYDNFDTGGLKATGWTLLNDANYPTSYTVPHSDAFGGYSFRIQGFPPTGLLGQGIPRGQTTARAAAVCTNTVYTDFYVAADISDWQTNWFSSTNYTFAGLAARVTTSDSLATGTNWSAVALFQWLNVNTDGNGPGTAVFGLGWIINGNVYFNFPPLGDKSGIAPAAIAEWTLEHGHTYRLTFQGVGNFLTGQVFDTQDLTKPLGTVGGDTSLGQFQLFGTTVIAPAPTSGWSGVCAVRYSDSGDTDGVTDATFDNFYAAVTPPTSVSAPATPHGLIGAPQVVNRTPASWANFYSAAAGITFDATTLTATNNILTSAIRLILNGVDVSSSLTITPASPAPTNHVTFGLAGSSYSLASNMVYDASIILQDSYNRRITNVWTFDTFSDAYLAKYPNIECEDYDHHNGTYNDFPVTASGYSTNDNTWYFPAPAQFGAPIQYAYPINCAQYDGLDPSQWGYVGLNGVQSSDPASGGTTGDYYECGRTAPLAGQPLSLLGFASAGGIDITALLPAGEYRTGGGAPDTDSHGLNGDWVGTEEGGAWGVTILNITTNDNGYLYPTYLFDTKRAKYAALNATGIAQYGPPLPGPDATLGITGAANASWWDVEEYNVVATEGSDWFNYTKDNWGTATNYNVYLRAGCAATEHLYLYDGATTNRASKLGTFWCTNSLSWNWRYTPLLDGSGNPAVVSLGGTHTLRLEIDPEMPKFAAIEFGLALNYMAFVPAGRPLLVTNVVLSTTNRIASVVKGAGSTFTVSAVGTPGAQYYLVTSGNIKTALGSWTAVAGTTNTASAGGTWSATVSAAAPAYYRAVAINPHP